MLTLKDIAQEAGVSSMTVSRVINGHLSKVSKENAERIREIVKRRGYVPNSSARSLAARSSRIIAAIVTGDTPLASPYNAEFLGGVARLVQERGYYLMLRFTQDCEDITHSLRAWNVEGAIFLGIVDKHMRKIQSDNRIPLIYTDSYSSIRQISNVGLDDDKGGRIAADYLASLGHRGFAFIAPSVEIHGVDYHRLEGFRSALWARGLTLPPEHVLLIEDDDNYPSLAEKLCALKGSVTGLFATGDIFAARLIKALQKRGARVPEDFSIVGFDDMPIAQYVTPALTTIAQDTAKKAKMAVEMLFRHLEDPSAPAETVVLDVGLVERESAIRAGGD